MRNKVTSFQKRGMSMPTVLIFLMGFSMVGMSVMSLTVTTDRNTDRSSSKVQATLLAESGMMDLYDRIRAQMWADGTYPFSISSTNLTANSRLGNRSVGTYSARVVNATSSLEDVALNGATVRRQSFIFEIEATGIGQDGIMSRVRGQFTATIDLGLKSITTVTEAPTAGKISFPAAAIVSNSQVKFKTNQGVRVYSPDGRSGHVIGNQGLSWNPESGSKASFANPNVLDVQGLYMAGQASYATTISANGIGNSGTTKNYRSPLINGIVGLPNIGANSVVSLSREVGFADQAKTETWKNNWVETTTKSTANKYSGSVNASSIAARAGDGWKVLETPAHIVGALNIPAGQQLRLIPTSSNPTENVIYVKGNVKNLGQLLNLGVTIVVEGKYTDGPSSEYKVDTQGSPYGTTKTVLQNSAFVSLNPDPDAINISSNSSVTSGVIYSARGGINITGNLEMRGMLVGYKDINIAPKGGNSFVLHYEKDAAGLGDFDPTKLAKINTSLVPNGIVNPFLPSPITNWVQMK